MKVPRKKLLKLQAIFSVCLFLLSSCSTIYSGNQLTILQSNKLQPVQLISVHGPNQLATIDTNKAHIGSFISSMDDNFNHQILTSSKTFSKPINLSKQLSSPNNKIAVQKAKQRLKYVFVRPSFISSLETVSNKNEVNSTLIVALCFIIVGIVSIIFVQIPPFAALFLGFISFDFVIAGYLLIIAGLIIFIIWAISSSKA